MTYEEIKALSDGELEAAYDRAQRQCPRMVYDARKSFFAQREAYMSTPAVRLYHSLASEVVYRFCDTDAEAMRQERAFGC